MPSVAQIGGELKCPSGDHPFSDPQTGWGFCYPATWRYNERAQASQSPPGLDLTFDITDIPCTSPSGPSARPVCSPNAGLFAFMIISTYQRGSSTSIADWAAANPGLAQKGEAISWGNAAEAIKLADGRRVALTPHYVVILSLHSGQGNLDLEAQMSTRLNTWKFTF